MEAIKTEKAILSNSFWGRNYDLLLMVVTIVAGGFGMILRSDFLFSLGFIGAVLYFVLSAIPKNHMEKKDERIIEIKHRALLLPSLPL